MKTNTHFLSFLAQFFLEWEMFETKFVENIKTHISCSIMFLFFRKSCRLWDNVETFCRDVQATNDNMALCELHAGYLGLQLNTPNKQY